MDPALPSRPTPEAPVHAERGRLPAPVEALARKAAALAGMTRRLALASLLAGAWLWGVLAYPFAFGAWWSAALAGLGLLVLLAPGGVLWLFYLGLRELMALPARVSGALEAGGAHATALYDAATAPGTRRRTRWGRLIRGVLDLRRLVLESKGQLLQYAALVRLLNPWALLAVAAAVAAALGLVAAAVLSLPLLVLF